MEPSWTVASTDDVTVAGYELGGAGDVLLISHATGLCGPMYRLLAEQLTAGFRVVAFDYRGHGRSSSPGSPEGLAWDRITDDTLAVRAELGGGRVHAFGHSMGAACLLQAERRAPGSFATLFLFEPIVFTEAKPAVQSRLAEAARRRRPEFPSRADAMLRYASRPPYDSILAGALADYVEHGFADGADGAVRLRCQPETEATVFANGAGSTIDGIDGIDAPTVVATGRPPGPAQLADAVASRLQRGELITYPQLGHFGPLQDPITLAAGITEHAQQS